jgi:putative copper resistance protein D
MGEDLAATRVLVATVMVNLGLAGIVGAWASMLWLRRAASPWAAVARRRSWSALKAALAFAVIADGLLLWLQAAYMGQVPLSDAITMLPSIALQTYVGRSWSAGVLGLLLVVLAASGSGARGTGLRLAGAAIGISIFVFARAAVSHAGDAGLGSLPLLVEGAHLWAISLWLGVVGIAAWAVLADGAAVALVDRSDMARWVQTLSSVATGALAVVIGSGLFNAWRGIASAANLIGSAYGTTLVVKVALVLIAFALGGFNRLQAMPRLLTALRAPADHSSLPRRFVQVLRIEAVVLFAALMAAALLSSSPLPTAT